MEDLGQPFGSFTSLESSWVDECQFSSSGGPITLHRWEIAEDTTGSGEQNDVLGGMDPDGVGCWSFAQWTDWAPYIAQMGYLAADALNK